jgi:hypothetical protein
VDPDLEAIVFVLADIRKDVAQIRELLEDEDGEEDEES